MIDTGLDRLLTSLAAIGADTRLTLPGVDDPTCPSDYMRRCLALMQDREVPFDMAWSSTINRIQAPQAGDGSILDPTTGELIVEQRALLEESRPYWQAAYEGREVTSIEVAHSRVATWRRIDDRALDAKLARREAGITARAEKKAA